MAMQVKGILVQVLKPESGVGKTGKEWTKQDFVIETQEQFPKKVCFTLFGDKTSLIDGIAEGSEIEVFFNLESRDFNGKWYHNINCWKIESGEQQSQNPPQSATNQPSKSIKEQIMEQKANEPAPEEDDLPF